MLGENWRQVRRAMADGRRAAPQRHTRPWLESLEERVVPDASAPVTFQPNGGATVQHFPGLSGPNFGPGLGDLNSDGKIDATDVALFGQVLESGNTQFNAAADMNGNGVIDNKDLILFGQLLQSINADATTMGAYEQLVGLPAGGYTINEGGSLTLSVNPPAGVRPTLGFTWDVNNHDANFGDASGAGATLTAAQLAADGVAEDGTYPIAVRVGDVAEQVDLTTVITVNEGAAPSGVTIRPAKNAPFSATLGTFTDSAGDDAVGGFTATIDWGDGQNSPGVVSASGGAFVVSGSHTYARGGDLPVTVTVTESGHTAAVIHSTAAIRFDVVLAGSDLTLFRTPGGGLGAVSYVLDGRPQVDLIDVTSLTFQGGASPGVVTVSLANGGPLVSGAISFNGGSGFDTLVVDAAGKAVQTQPGMIIVADPQVLTYSSGVTQLNINNAATVVAFSGPDTADRAAAMTGLSADLRFVQAVYLDVLGRPGSPGELSGWATLFSPLPGQHTQGQAAIVSAIEHSLEAADRRVQSWYVAYLGRQAQNGEELGWAHALQSGQTEEFVISQLLASQEFYARAQTLVATGTADERYAGALYQLLLHRSGSAAELGSWAGAVAASGRLAAAQTFLGSAEFRTYQFEGYFDALLRRPSFPAELADLVYSSADMMSVRIGLEDRAEFYFDG